MPSCWWTAGSVPCDELETPRGQAAGCDRRDDPIGRSRRQDNWLALQPHQQHRPESTSTSRGSGQAVDRAEVDRAGGHERQVREWAHTDARAYRAIRYTERLAEAEAVASVGSRGDSYDNAMAEALNSLFKAECIRNPVMRPKGGWKSVSDVEIAVAEYVDWFNHRRPHGEIGLVPPAEFEADHWASVRPEHYPENRAPAGAGSK